MESQEEIDQTIGEVLVAKPNPLESAPDFGDKTSWSAVFCVETQLGSS